MAEAIHGTSRFPLDTKNVAKVVEVNRILQFRTRIKFPKNNPIEFVKPASAIPPTPPAAAAQPQHLRTHEIALQGVARCAPDDGKTRRGDYSHLVPQQKGGIEKNVSIFRRTNLDWGEVVSQARHGVRVAFRSEACQKPAVMKLRNTINTKVIFISAPIAFESCGIQRCRCNSTIRLRKN